MKTNHTLRTAALAAALISTSLLGACSGGGKSSGVAQAESTSFGVAGTTPVEIIERWLAFFADEATTGPGGTDFNGNGSVVDSIPTVVNVATKVERTLDVEGSAIAMISAPANGTHLYTRTDESIDQVDWSGDGQQDDIVLLHTNVDLATPMAYVATLDSAGSELVTVGDRLYFEEDATGLVAPQTSIMWVDTFTPLVPTRVGSADVFVTLEPELMLEDEGLIFMTLDETVEGRDLNGDLDMVDTEVLALLDGTDLAAAILEVPHALQDDSTPVRALASGPNDWLVAFLVDETNEGENTIAPPGGVNLNDIGLFSLTWWPTHCQAPTCVGCNDVDTLDEVLHWLDFADFSADPVLNAPTNTGLVGTDRVLITESGGSFFVATISDEADEGLCSLNGDADQLDEILRWVEATFPVLPPTSMSLLLALESVPGGTMGAATLSDRQGEYPWVTVVSESDDERDHDGDGLQDGDLLAWLDPGGAASWEFDHSNPLAAPINSVGTTWMAQRPERDRLPVTFPEAYFGAAGGDINGDGDILDVVPTFSWFSPSGTELDFPGPPIAVAQANAGITIAGSLGFYRVDEAADSRDWNGDGDTNDMVLFRTVVQTLLGSFFISTLNTIPGPAVFRPDPNFSEVTISFIADEVMDGVDYNGDGDTADLVMRWFRIG